MEPAEETHTATVKHATTVEALRMALEQMGLSTKGHKPELKQRYRKAVKKQKETAEAAKAVEAPPEPVEEPAETKKKQPFDYYLFFDVEATCEANGGFTFPNEIIEFPVVLVDGETFDIVDEFRSYVKPTINSTLSDFCKQLTGISQETVDKSPIFIDVLNEFQEFMAKYDLFQTKSAAFVTDGPFDIRDFITKQLKHSKIKPRPAYFDMHWVNIRKLFREFYKQKDNKNINLMLQHLGLTFQGREHSGLDDAKNLVAIGRRMHEEGCVFKTNCWFDPKKHRMYDRKPSSGRKRR
ncbi:substrate-specific activator of APC-dependent proteolysis [Mucor velutinosus]|uniref:Substrate-specific activator of APC-dependent proteolysis n=1 Tax=Mucor velutinosus TaxID=708070 RepID=A0AAN7HQ54_9FUNG|nr:substrate-specific activator of APC-dependent proteolysis [Mucor velutinosus]